MLGWVLPGYVIVNLALPCPALLFPLISFAHTAGPSWSTTTKHKIPGRSSQFVTDSANTAVTYIDLHAGPGGGPRVQEGKRAADHGKKKSWLGKIW